MRVRDLAVAGVILCAGFAATQTVVAIGGGAPPALIGSALAADGNQTAQNGDIGDERLEQLGRDLDRLREEAGRDAQKSLERALDNVRKHLYALRAAGIAGWKEALDAYRKSLREYERAQNRAEITEI